MTKKITEVRAQDFTSFLKFAGPVVIDFTAHWCKPCRRVDSLMDRLAEEYKGLVKVARIDIDSRQNQEIAKQYKVWNIPAVLVFKAGEEVGRAIAIPPYEYFSDIVIENL